MVQSTIGKLPWRSLDGRLRRGRGRESNDADGGFWAILAHPMRPAGTTALELSRRRWDCGRHVQPNGFGPVDRRASLTDHLLLFTFTGGSAGAWAIDRMVPVAGEPLPDGSDRLEVVAGAPLAIGSIWTLRGVTSNARYTTKAEAQTLSAKQPPLGRADAKRAVLIPIRKSEAWWALAQDERREIYEERSNHTTIGMHYLPRVARRLHHSRDLGEPFDFLTWFEFAPEHETAFIELLGRLREREEWHYVEREVEVWVFRE